MRAFLFLLLLLIAEQLRCENEVVRYLTVEDGLTQNEITGIVHDSKGFMWFATRGGLNRYDGYEIVQFKPRVGDPNSISNPSIECLYEDSKGRFWIGTKSGGVDMYDPTSGKFRHFRNDSLSKPQIGDNRIVSIFEQSNGNIWFGGWTGGISIWNSQTDSIQYHFQNHKISAIKSDDAGNIWIGTNRGVYQYKIEEERFEKLKMGAHNRSDINDLVIDSKRNVLWITAWDKGLIRHDLNSGKTKGYLPGGDSELKKRFNRNSYSILLDSKGMVHMGTWGGGLFRFDPDSEQFSKQVLKPQMLGELNTDYDIVLKIIEDKTGTIWVGTDGGGVCRLSEQPPFQGISVYNERRTGIENYHMLSLLEDKSGKLWLGTKGGGLYLSNDRNNFIEIKPNDPKNVGPDYKVIKCMWETADGKMWVGSNFGLHEIISRNGNYYLSNYAETANLQIRKILSIHEKDGLLMLGTQQQGLWVGEKLNTNEENWKQYSTGVNSILQNERISFIRTDSKKRTWIGTYKGVYFFDEKPGNFSELKLAENNQLSSDIILCWCQLDEKTYLLGTPSGLNLLSEGNTGEFQVEHFYQKEGLPDDYIHAIVSDENRHLWISTNSGISRFNPDSKSFSNYDVSDGLQGRSFSEDCAFKNSRGEIFFGGASGINYFHPENIKDNTVLPNPAIISLEMHNKRVMAGEELHGRNILDKNISYTEELELTHREGEFSLTFAALAYDAPERNKYAYRLLNYDKRWNYSGSNRTVTYNQLRAGKYVFEVKASNNHNVWNEKPVRLHIKVIPAPWKSWWAIVIYILIALGLVALIRWVAVRQSRMAHRLEMESMKLDQVNELNEMKLRFFTNISHEFRTPLTLILAPVQELLKGEDLPSLGRKKLKVIEQNSKKLLGLVGQLLDFRKAETGKMKILVRKLDLIKFLNQEIKAFRSLAESKNVELSFEHEVSQLTLWFDPEKIGIVLNNLLSNAFKYVSEEGHIAVKVKREEEKVSIQVCDNGQGIPESDLKRIFDRFYQVESNLNRSRGGSGIGLALSKRIVELHQGVLAVRSTRNVETVFTIELLLGKEQYEENQLEVISEVQEHMGEFVQPAVDVPAPKRQVKKEKGERDVILIVEDQEDINNYISDMLGEDYDVIQKFDGIEGYANAMQSIPDIIISDVMMPGMDGFELCEKIKKEERTAHIPIILLTAKTADQFKIKGLTTGADAYLTKPFNPEELKTRVYSLLKNRKMLKESFSKKVKLEPTDIEISSYEEDFLNKAVQIVEKQMHEADFNTEVLASSLNMSSSTLYRKLKQLTGMSTSIFIRTIRLKRAAQLLADPQKTIAEISVQVGISDLKYFRKCFRELFGSSPSDYRQGIEKQ